MTTVTTTNTAILHSATYCLVNTYGQMFNLKRKTELNEFVGGQCLNSVQLLFDDEAAAMQAISERPGFIEVKKEGEADFFRGINTIVTFSVKFDAYEELGAAAHYNFLDFVNRLIK